jgi:hypothetical protein
MKNHRSKISCKYTLKYMLYRTEVYRTYCSAQKHTCTVLFRSITKISNLAIRERDDPAQSFYIFIFSENITKFPLRATR